jgi:aspartyl-tRNA(Asn)/glutamyl-tRNA(Gln) amidotransferase subunit A
VPDYTAALADFLAGLRIGVPAQFSTRARRRRGRNARSAGASARALGARELVEVELPNLRLSVPAYYIVAPAEASSNLSRFDGVRFGHRADAPGRPADLYKRTRQEGFGAEVKRAS